MRKERILVVDDEPQVLLALEEALEESFDVSTTDDPMRALRLLESEDEIAVVVSDQRMPHMNGDELFRRARDRSQATRVLVTGYADLKAVTRAVNEGNIFAYITKPWDLPDLLDKLKQAAERFRFARELDADRRLLEELMTCAPDGIFFKDREQRFRRANDGWVRLLELSSESELIGKRLSELGHLSSDRTLAIEATESETLHDGEPRRDVLCLQDSTGKDKWLSTSVAAVRSPSGEVTGLVGIAHDVTESAYAAVERAKQSPHAHKPYVPASDDRVAERLALERRLVRAVANEEFVLYYQPKVQLGTGQVVGVEALLRWRDPEFGLIPPDVFIPVLEGTEMIVEVGRWVLETAAKQLDAWKRSTVRVPHIAVNVSPSQFAQANFIDVLDWVLGAHPEARDGLELELTESLLMEDLPDSITKLNAVKERGVRVVIDDFGIGYSSLGHLSRLSLDALKIDRSFVDRVPDDPDQVSIVKTIVSLARSLHVIVIAEGVETPMQAHLLKLLGCDEIQGYLVSEPLPAEEVAALFAAPFEFPLARGGDA